MAVATAMANAASMFEPGRDAGHAVGERFSDRLIDAELPRAGYPRKRIAAAVNDERFDAVVTGVLAGLTLNG